MAFYAVEKIGGDLWLTQNKYDSLYEQKTESLFAQCNGYLGVRAANGLPALGQKRGMFVAGLFNRAYEEEVTELVNCPDIVGFHILLDGRDVTPDGAERVSYRRSLCLATGELCIQAVFALPDGRELELEERRLASMQDPHIFAQKVLVRARKGNFAKLNFATEMDGQQTNSGVSHFRKVECRVYEKRVMHLTGYLASDALSILSDYTCAVAGEGADRDGGGFLFTLKRRGITASCQEELQEGDCWKFEKFSYVQHLPDKLPVEEQRALLAAAREAGYEAVREAHRKVMEALCAQSEISIEGASLEEQAALAFARYHMIGMMPWGRNDSSIASKGLTGEGYKGHVFWDTEIFLLPFFSYLFPAQARKLLEFRYRGLDGARKKAREFGFRGAMFPWEVAAEGVEETPRFAALNIHTGKANEVWSGLKEHHVTADIGYALEQYCGMTEDREFLRRYGYELFFEIAEFWVSRAVWCEERQKQVILDIIGPDEYTEHIDNNAYTNYMARYCVKLALGMAEEARREAPEVYARLHVGEKLAAWERFAEQIYLPQPNGELILPQDDTFLSKKCVPDIAQYKTSQIKQKILQDYSRDEIVDMQVLKQADVVMLLNLFPRLFPPEVVKKNVLFYEARTIHDSSLSLCAHAQACAAIREKELAWGFFEKCLQVDLNDNPYDSVDGIHAASMGGIWSCVIFGFAGVSFQNGTLYLAPQLPEHWKRMRFRICLRGKTVAVDIDGGRVSLCTEGGEQADLPVQVNGNSGYLRDRLTMRL